MASGAQVCMCNRYGQTPLDKAKPHLRQLLQGQMLFVGIVTHQEAITMKEENPIYCIASSFFIGFRKGRENGSEYDQSSL